MFNKLFLFLEMATILILSVSSFADTLFMKNGDRIAGEITKVEVETDYSLVAVSAERISAVIFSNEDENQDTLIMKNEDKISGFIYKFYIETDYGMVEIPKESIKMVSFSVEPPFITGWEFSTKGPIVSSPVMEIEKNRLYIGSQDYLYVLDSLNGELIWKFQTKGKIYSTPALYKDFVYVTTKGGYVYVINTKNERIN